MATILVVDDEPDVVDIVRFRLERDGHTVLSAGDGRAGIDSVVHHKPDLVILDVMMPGIDGFEVLYQIRHGFHIEKTPVILLTAKAGFLSSLQGWQKEANDYIVKPFDLNQLAETVRKVLDSPDSADAAGVEVEKTGVS